MANVTMSLKTGAGMAMDLQTWRGYSAYELAVQNGFEGTEQEWLESLKGTNGQTTSVNGVEQHNGNVSLTGANIPISASDGRRISELAAPLDALLSAIGVDEDSVDLGGRYLDNALFR